MRIVGLGLLLLSLAGCQVSFTPPQATALPAPTQGTEEQRGEALKAAEGYLALIDGKHYAETWKTAGPALKGMSNELMWVNTLKLTGKIPLPEGRELHGIGFNTRVDARAPEGEYVVLEFVRRAGDTTATEKMVMQKHESRWMIIGYFVHKRVNILGGKG